MDCHGGSSNAMLCPASQVSGIFTICGEDDSIDFGKKKNSSIAIGIPSSAARAENGDDSLLMPFPFSLPPSANHVPKDCIVAVHEQNSRTNGGTVRKQIRKKPSEKLHSRDNGGKTPLLVPVMGRLPSQTTFLQRSEDTRP